VHHPAQVNGSCGWGGERRGACQREGRARRAEAEPRPGASGRAVGGGRARRAHRCTATAAHTAPHHPSAERRSPFSSSRGGWQPTVTGERHAMEDDPLCPRPSEWWTRLQPLRPRPKRIVGGQRGGGGVAGDYAMCGVRCAHLNGGSRLARCYRVGGRTRRVLGT
jgi:hypothetical protein